jgi:trans-2,3-dihydro-3-hydroxyanthranilate isomerase
MQPVNCPFARLIAHLVANIMPNFQYRLVNVFAESTFGGNPLCVFEDARGLNDDQMQALALQFNLSETTFVLPSANASARIRIFTPTFEMAFAGHPTLGSAHVVRELKSAGDNITLEMKAGVIPVSAKADRWTFQANTPTSREATLSRAELAAALGIVEADVIDGARWVNTGSEQLIIPLFSADAVRRVTPQAERLAKITSNLGRSMAYVFAANGEGKLLSRFFFMTHSSVVEDPGTGSATANLGGWMIHHGRTPCSYAIEQGAQVGRACHLELSVDAQQHIFVSGQVIEIGRGTITIN